MAGKKGMHKRWLNDPHTRERIIQLIQSSKIANMLISYCETGEGMDNSRAQIALGLLRKVAPDLSAAELAVENVSYISDLQAIQGAIRARAEQDEVAPVVH